MRNVSKKLAAKRKIYNKLRDKFLEENSTCMFPECEGIAVVHHSKGRIGDNLTDVSTFRNLCHGHHDYVELHPVWAKENGYSQSRLDK
ncbi:MAG: hypothetical protein COA36_16695 [Desulfotalea sp.]|nr:MAG: hypothetical protein COA36_16695 [Desulfotalea sp.]